MISKQKPMLRKRQGHTLLRPPNTKLLKEVVGGGCISSTKMRLGLVMASGKI